MFQHVEGRKEQCKWQSILDAQVVLIDSWANSICMLLDTHIVTIKATYIK